MKQRAGELLFGCMSRRHKVGKTKVKIFLLGVPLNRAFLSADAFFILILPRFKKKLTQLEKDYSIPAK